MSHYASPPSFLLSITYSSSVWYEGNPCNMHLMDLAAEVKKGVEEIGLVGYRFNTIGQLLLSERL